MKNTLQEQYSLIKEGKGHRGVFMKQAKATFPNQFRNAATFDEIVNGLKHKNVIVENVVDTEPINQLPSTKKESYEIAFEKFLKESQEEEEKAELKKPSKQVEEDLSKGFDTSDKSNPDNLIFDQVMKGYYTEMCEPKNKDKTMGQLKAIIFKNLEKNPTYYTEKGQFGVKDLGYTTEHPGLGTPKEPKGKYKSSGYGDLKESIGKNYPDNIEGEYKGTPQKYDGSDIHSYLTTILDISNSEDDFIRKVIMGITDETSQISSQDEQKLRRWYVKNSSNNLNESEDFEGSGLTVTGRAQIDNSKIKSVIEDSGFYGVWNSREGYWFFPESEETLDALEEDLSQLLDSLDINYRIESQSSDNISEDHKPGDTVIYKGTRYEVVEETETTITLKDKNGNIITKNYNQFKQGEYKGDVNEQKLRKAIREIINMELSEGGEDVDYYISVIASNTMDEETAYAWLEDQGVGSSTIDTIMAQSFPTSESLNENVLRKIIRESVEKELAAINKEAESEVISTKLEKIGVAIEKRQSQLNKLDEDEDMKALTDKKKIKQAQKDIKTLEKAKAKLEKQLSKVAKKNKDVVPTEVIDEDEPIGEAIDDQKVDKVKTSLKDIDTTVDSIKSKTQDMFEVDGELPQHILNKIVEKFAETGGDSNMIPVIAASYPQHEKEIIEFLEGYDLGLDYDLNENIQELPQEIINQIVKMYVEDGMEIEDVASKFPEMYDEIVEFLDGYDAGLDYDI